ncbi:MAG: metallophosphoesterase [Planctomycetaceae bacterium]|nr:metallophosphoesterase [Planctomycetaceae bacterium]
MFRILHVSDLHARQSSRWSTDNLLSKVTEVLLRESDDDNFDVVAFTGDIAFSGKRDEYEIAEEWLNRAFLSAQGLNLSKNQLLFVPGNHDVDRNAITPAAAAIERELRRSETQEEIARHFCNEQSKSLLLGRHTEYAAFITRLRGHSELTLPSWTQTFEHQGQSIQFDGLCTSWVSSGDDDHGSLLVGQPQLTDRLNARTPAMMHIVMMHHPLAWLREFDARNTEQAFRSGNVLLLRGHLHRPDQLCVSTRNGVFHELPAGSLHESHDSPNSFSIIDVSDDYSIARVKTYLWRDRQWIHDRNVYPESADGVGVIEFAAGSTPIRSERQLDSTLFSVSEPNSHPVGTELLQEQIAPESNSSNEIHEDRGTEDTYLPGFPRFRIKAHRQFEVVRENAREAALLQLEQNRLVRLQAQWGSAPLAFVATLLKSRRAGGENTVVLHGRCAGASTGLELQSVLESQAQLSAAELGNTLRHGPSVILLLDDIRWDSVESSQDTRSNQVSIRDTVAAFLDYCPNLQIILVSYQRNDDWGGADQVIMLDALDAADTRPYMNAHETHSIQLDEIVDYDRVHRVTGGLPSHIDNVLQALTYTNLNGALAEFSEVTHDTPNELPGLLVDSITKLAEESDDLSCRAYSMLTLLCVLEYGEALLTIKRIVPQSPLWPKHAHHLQELGLLDVIDATPMATAANTPAHRVSDTEKLLKVPRIVRDHVIGKMPEEDRVNLLRDAASVYFGSDWRTGKIRVRIQRATGSRGCRPRSGNELAVLEQILKYALRSNTSDLCSPEEAIRLSLKYVDHLQGKGLYGECYASSRDLLAIVENLADASLYVAELAEIKLNAGRCARMVGEHAAAIDYLTSVLPSARSLDDKSRVADILLELALSHESLGNEHDAIQLAEEVIADAPNNSHEYLQAKAIIAGYERDVAARKEKLGRLENRARTRGHYTVANNIALELAAASDTTDETLKHLSRVRSHNDKEYNYIRATIRRVETLLDSNRVTDITDIDERDLRYSYIVAYSQRIRGIFNWCHRVMWRYFETKDQQQALLELFEHSSFIWRLSGDTEREHDYAKRCAAIDTGGLGTAWMTVSSFIRYCHVRIKALSQKLPFPPNG